MNMYREVDIGRVVIDPETARRFQTQTEGTPAVPILWVRTGRLAYNAKIRLVTVIRRGFTLMINELTGEME